MLEQSNEFNYRWKCGACRIWAVDYVETKNGNYVMQCRSCGENAPYTGKKKRKRK